MTPVLLSCLLIQPAELPAWKITGAALFKNGYSVVFREASIEGKEVLDLPVLSGATLGTLWFTTSGESNIKSLVNTTTEVKTQGAAANMAEILRLNKGKTLLIETLKFGASGTDERRGVLLDLVAGSFLLQDGGSQILVPVDSVRTIRTLANEKLIYQSEVVNTTRSLRFTFDKGSRGKVYSMSLESGLSWFPSYSVSLKDDKKLTLTGKATLINDLGSFEGADLMLVTGFPHLPFLGQPDPLVAQRFARALEQGMPGGLGGGTAGRFANQAPAAAMPDVAGGFQIPDGEGTQAEDLFFYKPPRISLKQGDRGYTLLFQKEAEYKSVYKAKLGDPMATGEQKAEFWHTLEFDNPAGQPLTTAPAVTMRDGQIIGQDEIGYTSAKAKVNLRVNRALDIAATAGLEEVDRQRDALKDRNGNPIFDLATLEGKITARNLKPRAVEAVIEMPVTGEATAKDAVVARLTSGLQQVNPTSMITWRLSLKPGETVTLPYTVKVYVGR